MTEFTADQLEEIATARDIKTLTGRPTVAAIEAILHTPMPVLDHGFVRVVDYMGDDAAIAQAARVSYGRGTKQVSQDSGLIRYLMRQNHSSPFEMPSIKLHVKLPIFVARQWIRHRTASVNECSARYSIMDKEFYIPSPEHIAVQSSSNRQGRGEVLSEEAAHTVINLLREDAQRNYDHYESMMEELNLAREIARVNLTLNTYTQWYWKIDLHNLFHFLSLRADPHAQFEIREYTDVILKIVRDWVPVAYQAFQDYRLGALTFSAQQLKAIRWMVAGIPAPADRFGLSQREWEELQAAIALTD